jgi:hypothetical protein
VNLPSSQGKNKDNRVVSERDKRAHTELKKIDDEVQ